MYTEIRPVESHKLGQFFLKNRASYYEPIRPLFGQVKSLEEVRAVQISVVCFSSWLHIVEHSVCVLPVASVTSLSCPTSSCPGMDDPEGQEKKYCITLSHAVLLK